MNETSEISINLAEEKNSQQIIKLASESGLSDWKESDYKAEFERRDAICLVAVNNKKVLGFIIARLIKSDFDVVTQNVDDNGEKNVCCVDGEDGEKFTIEIFNIAVRLDERRRKIGQKLLDALLLKARSIGAVNCWLEVRASNATAREFYKKNGFVDVGRRRNYYSNPVEDSILMNSYNF